MSDLLSGLGSLGLGSLEKMNLFDEPEEKEEKKEEKEVVIDETDYVLERTFECPICDSKFKSLMARTGKSKLVGTDLDLRPIHEYVDLTKYDVVVCQDCGYAALSRYYGHCTDKQRKSIMEKISANYKGDKTHKTVYTYEEALSRYQLALVNAIVRQAKNSEKAYICLKAGWLVRGYAEWLLSEEGKKEENAEQKREQALKMEEDYLKNAFEGFQAAMASESFPIAGMDETTMNYLIAALAYRCDRMDIAGTMVSRILVNPATSNRIKDRARELKDLIIIKLKESKKNG